jgi:hypothetical protein
MGLVTLLLDGDGDDGSVGAIFQIGDYFLEIKQQPTEGRKEQDQLASRCPSTLVSVPLKVGISWNCKGSVSSIAHKKTFRICLDHVLLPPLFFSRECMPGDFRAVTAIVCTGRHQLREHVSHAKRRAPRLEQQLCAW